MTADCVVTASERASIVEIQEEDARSGNIQLAEIADHRPPALHDKYDANRGL